MSVRDLKTRTKILLASAGILGLAGVGLGAANAATPPPAPVTTQSVAADEATPGDVADAPDAAEAPDPADGPGTPGDSGTNEQTGDSTDPVDAPDAP
ncbi:hypothetical protein [Pseudarthrobacter sp. NPDC080039]|uniref:hypothetical protein n=1 Tax=unclassified Pseudarthrobacter TaxID=2647000 RepID=UPI00344B556B